MTLSAHNAIREKKQNRFKQALILPTLCNINPRSLYSKKKEFQTFLQQMEIDLAFISETWELVFQLIGKL